MYSSEILKSSPKPIVPNTTRMAYYSVTQLILFSFLISISFAFAQTSSTPKAFVLPVAKDAKTLQYTTQLQMGTPLSTKTFVVDIGGSHLWMDCDDKSYVSSTFKQSLCGSSTCSFAKATCRGGCLPGHHKQGCNNQICWVSSQNTVTNVHDVGYVSSDKFVIHSTDGAKSGAPVSISNFIFACSNNPDFNNLASGRNGMIGLGRERIGIPTQLSSVFGGSFACKFAICLHSNPEANGVLFLGDSTYEFGFHANDTIDFTTRFQYARLYPNIIRGHSLPDYFVKITSILVNQKPIPINPKLLQIQASGFGGTKVSTIEPYTKLESTIYKDLVEAFDKEINAAWNVTRIAAVAPFTHCYGINNITHVSGLGILVPEIGFVFDNNKNVYWKFFGVNSMVLVNHPEYLAACLAFVDGNVGSTPITIGAHQMEEHVVQFDLASNRFAFSSTLHGPFLQCSNFKF